MDTPDNKIRSRVVTWEDPIELVKISTEMDGLSFLKLMIENKKNPPIASSLSFKLTEATEGKAVFTFEPAEYHYNPLGVVHGGVAATVLDAAMACAIHSLLPKGKFCTTLEIKVNYLRAITLKSGLLRCEGEVIHLGKQTSVTQGKVLDNAGKLYATATATFMILKTDEK